MQTTVTKVKNRIRANKRGWVFTPKDFSDLGESSAILVVLSRLAKEGHVRRLAQGIYDYPVIHEKLGEISPAPEAIAGALVREDKTKLLPSGAYAANLVGLSQQVPAQVVFLNDSIRRKIKVANMTIELKQTTRKTMATAGRISGILIQALKHLGEDRVDKSVIAKLKRSLDDDQFKQIRKDIRYASPAWVANALRELSKEGK